MLEITIPTDSSIFRGVGIPPTRFQIHQHPHTSSFPTDFQAENPEIPKPKSPFLPSSRCRLCKDAPTLLWTLLDGLLWRSRLTFQAQRRVNYYVKHLVQEKRSRMRCRFFWISWDLLLLASFDRGILDDDRLWSEKYMQMIWFWGTLYTIIKTWTIHFLSQVWTMQF